MKRSDLQKAWCTKTEPCYIKTAGVSRVMQSTSGPAKVSFICQTKRLVYSNLIPSNNPRSLILSSGITSKAMKERVI